MKEKREASGQRKAGDARPEDKKDPVIEDSRDNNQTQVSITVNEDPYRVLLIDYAPRWDARYLMTMFDRDRRVEVTRRYLHVRRAQKKHELLPLKQEALDLHDVVVLGDLRADELHPEARQQLADFVAKRGGFLIVLAGPRAMPHAHTLGPLAEILPVLAKPGRGGREETVVLKQEI